ncbi:isoflavone reductase P3 [Fusarium tjaetaba]|uniref:Isoflavone reductase P3 n=1 Tax=Fusarium tjaetaba TaxID=1567544 RepID=A0A8H5QYN6_9HYPO|nr:isoflavone reductase P3 [Fusarium tjaetaba]KAF5623697.1 isoflavone reductase P3 [Fusarium tjaetaba]
MSLNVTIVGANGEAGLSIIDALSPSPSEFKLTAIVRPASINKPEIQQIKNKGVSVVPINLENNHDELVKALTGQDVVISCLVPFTTGPEIALANASKEAGIKRFLPSAFGPPCPPEGVMLLRELKETIINHVKKIYLPYTVVDVGMWYQVSLPSLPSGKIDYALKFPAAVVAEDGSHATSLTDLRDIGHYVAKIITDERTLNKYVFAYNEVWTQEEIHTHLEKVSGEKIPRNLMPAKDIEATIADAQVKYDASDKSLPFIFGLAGPQYLYCEWFRQDNLPGPAEYLGYLSSKDLYPDFEPIKYVDYVDEVMQGKGKSIYVGR